MKQGNKKNLKQKAAKEKISDFVTQRVKMILLIYLKWLPVW